MYITKRIFLINILILLACLTGQSQNIEFEKVNVKKFEALIKDDNNHVLINVCATNDEPKESISGSIFAETSKKLFSILDTTPVSRPILLYCKYGKRSQRAAWLIKEKYPHQVYSLKGGIEVWHEKRIDLSTHP